MFSSLAALLPSALHINATVDLPKQTVDPEESYKEDQENAYGGQTIQPRALSDQGQQSPTKGKEKDAKSPSETFIFVRPPPSKTNHPLNLQVQLVPPNTKPPGGITGTDDNTTTPTSASSANSNFSSDGAPLSRTSSSRSSVSYTSTAYGSSTTSFSSFSSTSARRTIIPLYNLQAHNVMTNVIVDAGTDAKIAKFQKRGIELIDLALLEPVEVWGEGGRERDARRESMRIVADEMGASVVVNANGRKTGAAIFAPKSPAPFLQPGGSRPVTPSATSSATSLPSQTGLPQLSIPPYLNQQYYTPPSTAASDIFPISHSNSSASDNPTPVPPASPVPVSSMSLAMSPLPSPSPGAVKRNLFNKLFTKKQNTSNLLSPSRFSFPSFPGQQQELLSRSPPPPTINSPDLEVPAPPTFALSPLPKKALSTVEKSFIVSMKRRSAAPSAPSPFSTSEVTSAGVGMTPRTEEQTTPTQVSIAGGGTKTKTIPTISSPTPHIVEVPREHERKGGKRHGTPSNQRGNDRDRDTSPHLSLGSNDKRRSQSRSSLVGTSSTNDSADSHGGGAFNFGTGGNEQALPQVVMTPVQAQSEIMMNLRQQQLQLRPPVLDIQPTFVISNPSSTSSNQNPSNHHPSDAPSATTTENPDQLIGQRALMYVWLVRRWMKKRSLGHVGFGGLGDSAVGFLGGVVGGLKGEREKGKEKMKDRKHDSGDHRPRSSHGGLAAVTAPLMYGGVEVRFEWKRTKSGKEKGGSRKTKSRTARGRTAGEAESDGEVETTNRQRESDDRDERGPIRRGGSTKTTERLKSEEKKKFRMSTGSIKSITADSVIDGELGTKRNQLYDDGEDSDPEDSETPWVCTLKLRRGATAVARGLNPAAGHVQPQPPVLQTEVLRIKVGTLLPTPYHPKVVAMLKVPFPLPNVEVERMGVVKRQGANPTHQNSTYDGLVLTAEEIKDVVCSTGLWLVVREGFGGVGKVTRKGDGWRIRP